MFDIFQQNFSYCSNLPLVEKSLKIFFGDVITSHLLLVEKLIVCHGSANTLNLLLVEKTVQCGNLLPVEKLLKMYTGINIKTFTFLLVENV